MIFIMQYAFSIVNKLSLFTLLFRTVIHIFDKIVYTMVTEKERNRILGIPVNRLRNKYLIASFFFILWLSFFDQNNWVERLQNMHERKQLKMEREYYRKKIDEDNERLKELKTNNENLEKFAREQYLMKKDNEDVYIIVDE
jgi:cell division protein DivIC